MRNRLYALIAASLLFTVPAFAQSGPGPVPNGSAGVKNLGVSVNDPGTGNLEALSPPHTVTQTSYVFGATDLQKETRRSAGGSAMSDTLPASTAAGMANGAVLTLDNVDASASDTVTAGSGTTIEGNSSIVVPPGRDLQLVYDFASSAWRTHYIGGTAPLPVANGGTNATSLGAGLTNSGNVLNLGNTHLVVYTIAPAGASAADKQRADYVATGTNDQVACQAAVTAAGTSTPSEIVMLPGNYTFSGECDLNLAAGSVFMALGTHVTGPGGTADTFVINKAQVASPNYAYFYFGQINANGSTGSAIRNDGGAIEQQISWQSLSNTSQNGYGYYADADTADGGAAQSVDTLIMGDVHGFNYGVYLNSSTNIDTYQTVSNGYLYQNNRAIMVNSHETGNVINANVWNANVDASWSTSAIAFETNEEYSTGTIIVGGLTGAGANIKLDSGATANHFNVTPVSLASQAGSIIDASGNTTNAINGMTVTLFQAQANGAFTGHLAQMVAGTPGLIGDGGSITAQLDTVCSNTEGSLCTRGPTHWQNVTAGTVGQFLQYQGTGSPAAYASAPSVFAGSSGQAGVTVGTTNYIGIGNDNTTETVVEIPFALSGTFKGLYLSTSTPPGAGQTYVATLRVNNVSTAITCTISGASATTCSDTTDTAAITAGQPVDLQIVASASSQPVNSMYSTAFSSP